MLCDYQLNIVDLYNIPIGNVKKLVPKFFDREHYVIYCENLQLYLRLGLKLKETHLVLEFIRSQWLKPYSFYLTHKKEWKQKKKTKMRKHCTY